MISYYTLYIISYIIYHIKHYISYNTSCIMCPHMDEVPLMLRHMACNQKHLQSVWYSFKCLNKPFGTFITPFKCLKLIVQMDRPKHLNRWGKLFEWVSQSLWMDEPNSCSKPFGWFDEKLEPFKLITQTVQRVDSNLLECLFLVNRVGNWKPVVEGAVTFVQAVHNASTKRLIKQTISSRHYAAQKFCWLFSH